MMTHMSRAAVGEVDPREWLRGTQALKRLAETIEMAGVARARAAGLSWGEIAEELDVAKQVIHRKYKGKLFTQGHR